MAGLMTMTICLMTTTMTTSLTIDWKGSFHQGSPPISRPTCPPRELPETYPSTARFHVYTVPHSSPLWTCIAAADRTYVAWPHAFCLPCPCPQPIGGCPGPLPPPLRILSGTRPQRVACVFNQSVIVKMFQCVSRRTHVAITVEDGCRCASRTQRVQRRRRLELLGKDGAKLLFKLGCFSKLHPVGHILQKGVHLDDSRQSLTPCIGAKAHRPTPTQSAGCAADASATTERSALTGSLGPRPAGRGQLRPAAMPRQRQGRAFAVRRVCTGTVAALCCLAAACLVPLAGAAADPAGGRASFSPEVGSTP